MMPADAHLKTARVFFALWPDADMRIALDRLSGKMHALCGGRRTRANAMHITLAFLGEVPEARLAGLQTVAAQVRCSGCDIALTHLGWWPRSRIAWVAPAVTPQALSGLVHELQALLETAGFHFDERAYFPHVTLLRHADCRQPPAEMAALSWAARDFVLVKSVLTEHGPVYDVIGRWQLAAGSCT
jgi:RNA 2',3'-cyclic 3'-phosphodiesterase